MTDHVSIRDLHVPAVIGVHDWEREVTQTLVFSVDMAADVRKELVTSDSDGGGAAAGEVVGVGLVV